MLIAVHVYRPAADDVAADTVNVLPASVTDTLDDITDEFCHTHAHQFTSVRVFPFVVRLTFQKASK